MPDTGVAPCCRMNVAVVIVNGSIVLLNVADGFLLIATPVTPFAGSVEMTVGRVVSPAAPVVKLHT